jgi:hypothetical protein
MVLRENGRERIYWIELVEDRVQRQAVVNTVVKPPGVIRGAKIFASKGSVNVPRPPSPCR